MNMYLKDRDRPKGAMKPMPNLMETELESFGAVKIEDFTWKQLFDTDACTVCGRCTSVCPAHATGKPLDPREIVLKVGEVMAATGDPGRVAAGRRRPRHRDRRRQRVRAHHARRGLGVHELQGVRRDLPGQHRDPRQDPRHAPLPHADGERLPHRARQHVPLDGELRQRVRPEPGRPRRLGELARRRRHRRARRRRSTTSTSTSSGARAASTTATRRRRRALAKLLQRAGIDFAILGPSEMCNGDQARRAGQRVHLPDARDAERRDVRRHGREEDHHAVPALLQRDEERVPAARRQLRGHPPLPAARRARARRPALARGRVARRARHVPRLLLPRPPQRRVPRAPARRRFARRHRPRRDAAQRHQGHVLRRRRRAHVDGGEHRQEGQHRAQPGSDRDRRVAASRSRAPSAT